ncbi:hypothetical protein PIB30_087088, partial [Stylosanthes scabra]|nr:hypothetical protein [Stylosanthes scabra]
TLSIVSMNKKGMAITEKKKESASETSMLVSSIIDTTMIVSPMEMCNVLSSTSAATIGLFSKPNMEALLPKTKMVDLSDETSELTMTMLPPWKDIFLIE